MTSGWNRPGPRVLALGNVVGRRQAVRRGRALASNLLWGLEARRAVKALGRLASSLAGTAGASRLLASNAPR